jgi:hypothetical protein
VGRATRALNIGTFGGLARKKGGIAPAQSELGMTAINVIAALDNILVY